MDDRGRLTELVAGLVWTRSEPLEFFGLPIGARMTVVRLAGGRLFIHSPTALSAELQADLERLGTVELIVAPNRLHHLWVSDYARAYPGASIYASAALPRKRPDIAFHGVLEEQAEPEWSDEIDQVPFRGSAYLDEVVFYVAPARTLIVSDLLMCTTREDPWRMRWVARLLGTYGVPALPRDQRWLIRDRKAARASIERMLGWDFDRIVMAHGPLVDLGGKELFRRAFDWLFGDRVHQAH